MREAGGGDEEVREKQGEMRKEAGREVSVSLIFAASSAAYRTEIFGCRYR
jgi:hypothetical protein